jgi:hypothetical protein
MSIEEDQPDVALDISNEAKRTIQGKIVSSGIAGVLSLVPGVGGAVIEMMTELAIQRTNDRIKEMFEYFVNRIREVGEERVDRDWFRGEEFQTLLYEALHQLHVTRDREKIEMLGVSLANSGAPGFKGDARNDLFVRFVRDLAPQHIKMLVELAPLRLEFHTDLAPPPNVQPLSEETIQRLTWDRRPTMAPHNDDLLALQMLHAYGLVHEFLSSSVEEPHFSSGRITESDITSAIRKFVKQLQESPVRSFRISELGRDFLSFMGLPKGKAVQEKAPPPTSSPVSPPQRTDPHNRRPPGA